ncbi:mammalian cell entry protein [Mycobacterium sp. MS1601]|uniref:MCE family protein n=1 Tax=Mycobacterium sp. MS1601 TaxID=1936029 RepID=UPI0009795D24|nr:MCE family protein [Mycobacterium sp. MS1601]AQA05448.1 mammalian cell entry protein [Mycobacterium sp. MS1601]
MTTRKAVGALLVACLVAGLVVVWRPGAVARTDVVAYFPSTNGLYEGDEVRILGMPVGRIETITPEPQRVKVTFWVDRQYPIPADVNAVIISPALVSARAIALTPAYLDGAQLTSGSVIPESRTAVPVEWDDLRAQLHKLTESLQPAQPGGVSTLGAFVSSTADNLRGQGATARGAIIELSQALSALGDHSGDVFATIRHLSALVSALEGSTDLMAHLNQNLAAVTATLAGDPDEIGAATRAINDVVGDVQSFVGQNRETLGITADSLTSVSTALTESLDDIEQTLHIAPTALSNFINIYQPAQGSLSGALVMNNFANPISFICGAIQAASRKGAEESAKLCAQYLAPIIKNRQYNFPPIGINPFVGTQARPNEITYSEDWLRPGASLPELMMPGAGS